MKIKGAMTILNKRAEFYGKSFDWVIEFIDTYPMAESYNVVQAYEVYKQDQGYRWSGVNGKTWVKKEII